MIFSHDKGSFWEITFNDLFHEDLDLLLSQLVVRGGYPLKQVSTWHNRDDVLLGPVRQPSAQRRKKEKLIESAQFNSTGLVLTNLEYCVAKTLNWEIL